MSDFDDFLKESEGAPAAPDDAFEVGNKTRTLVDQLKEQMEYSGSPRDNEILQKLCEEYAALLDKEVAIMRQQIQELKDIKMTSIENKVDKAEEDSLEERANRAVKNGNGKFTPEMAQLLDESIKKK